MWMWRARREIADRDATICHLTESREAHAEQPVAQARREWAAFHTQLADDCLHQAKELKAARRRIAALERQTDHIAVMDDPEIEAAGARYRTYQAGAREPKPRPGPAASPSAPLPRRELGEVTE